MEQLNEILNIRGAEIWLTAKLAEMISPMAGTQGLDELAKREKFTTVVKDEVEARGLTAQRAIASLLRLDSLVPFLFDARSAVLIPCADFTNEERVALVIIFKVQEKWPKRFWFSEEKSVENNEALDYHYNYYAD
ncbi:hypothetical protein B9Z19DRAFT_1134973 [Tuber borchii]|uniref:Uncharacterized protein n=1 Tax=Tuber borchii TaxID=42251 RepID=A0A2T6ZDS5_TUBBO|nr:hypothetical protein B9Z19DRAFT_1134973 [Tuber borchii]